MKLRLLLPLGVCFLMSLQALAQEKPDVGEFQPVPAAEPLPSPPPPVIGANVEFRGITSFDEQTLRGVLADQLREINQEGLTRARADDTAFFLEVHYRKNGFSQALVRWEINGRTLTLKVEEGPRTQLGNVRFEGNKDITSETLEPYLTGATRERFPREKGALPFIEADITTGVERIRGVYSAEGYMDAVVNNAEITYSEDSMRADVLVRITEGIRYTFGAFTFTGDVIVPTNELLPALGEARDKPFTPLQLVTLERNLVYFYKSRGYFEAKVEAKTNPGLFHKGSVEVIFHIQAGPLFRFDGITATRTDSPDAPRRLQEGFLERRFGKLSGEIYNPEALDTVFRDMMRTGLFRNLRINSTAVPGNQVKLDLTYEEARARELGFSIGFGTFEGAMVGFTAGDRNFMGTGRALTSSLDMSQRTMRGEILYVDPWWLESDFGLRARIYASTRDVPGYSKFETGLRADVTRKLTKQIELGGFVQAEKVEITESVIDPVALGSTSYLIGTVGFTQSFDFRDHPLNPNKGWVINSAIDGSTIAGELAFGRATGRLSYYLPIRRSLLAFGFRGGLIYPLTHVPIDERFFLGGSTTVRSFAERELGPKDRFGNPIGGEAFTLFNVEYDFPITGALYGAAFVDAGNLVAEFNQAGVQDMRFAVGLGLRYKLPIGPVRLDYGVNPDPKEGEAFGAFHFSFGFAF
jgi:outer membrane protein insertion porin family